MDIGNAVEKITPILKKTIDTKDDYGICSFGFMDEETHKAYHHNVCHAGIESYRLKNDAFHYSSVTNERRPGDRTEINEFITWILGDSSPWKSILEGRERVILEDRGSIIGYVLPIKPEDSRALLSNLSMAIRFCSEHEPFFKAYLNFLELGLSETDAFFIGQHFKKVGVGVSADGVNNTNHIIAPEILDFNLKRFEEGRPHLWGNNLAGEQLKDQTKTDKIVNAYYSRSTTVFREEGRPTKLKKLQSCQFSEKSMQGRWTKAKQVPAEEVVNFFKNEYKPQMMKELESL